MFQKIIDLTHPLGEKNPNWEGTEKSPFEARELGNLKRDGYYSRVITLPEHFGTHMDAPAHFSAIGWRLEQIPAERLMGPLALLNVTEQCRKHPDYEVSVADVERWETKHGKIPIGGIVLANTGWAARWNSVREYRNADRDGVKHHPGYAQEAVRYLVELRGVYGIGIDTMGVDYGPSQTHPNHCYTSSKNVYHLENIADMNAVPETGAFLLAAPIKLEGGSGGPVRIFALIP